MTTTGSDVRGPGAARRPSRHITVLAVGGTGESSTTDTRTEVSGLLRAVTDRLDERFDARWVPYPAAYGPAAERGGMSYTDSVSTGVVALHRAVRAVHGPVMLVGYSQGAAVIRTFLAHPVFSALVDRIAAVGLVADPHQPPGVIAGCDGWGVAGPGAAIPDGLPVYWIGAPGDVICNASDDSLIRDVADLTDTLSLRRLRRWATDAAAKVMSRRMQNAEVTRFSPRQWRRDVTRLRTAAREVRGYLPAEILLGTRVIRNRTGGRHDSYASEPYRYAPLTDPTTTGCETLAHWMQLQATMRILH
ncbi:PE-PPE domain-containing protein [Gordonia shandongensis]|uniref:PE-PPE domain-containing protein n=1 Tax=Gordonia shandongensis TaxID=376351 RepID=UPI0006884454|nr:PE-PPE domain-containing protein [Gordonia shandongensis]